MGRKKKYVVSSALFASATAAAWLLVMADVHSPGYRRVIAEPQDAMSLIDTPLDCLPQVRFDRPFHRVFYLDHQHKKLLEAACTRRADCITGIDLHYAPGQWPQCAGQTSRKSQTDERLNHAALAPEPDRGFIGAVDVDCAVLVHRGKDAQCNGAFQIVAESLNGATSILRYTQTYDESYFSF